MPGLWAWDMGLAAVSVLDCVLRRSMMMMMVLVIVVVVGRRRVQDPIVEGDDGSKHDG